jgi:methylmalonyl-CoA mutase N-terminal domain/subunit
LVGVNHFVQDEQPPVNVFRVDDNIRKTQIEKIGALKKERDNLAVNASLSKLKHAAAVQENLMPLIIRSVENYATLGEIADTLRTVFGEY